MNKISKIKNYYSLINQLVRYNLKIIFLNKFVYFLLSSLLIFLLIAVISLLDADAYPTEESVYYILLFPGLLLIFYPTTFGVQNDIDTRMIELLFGIPNYRYKVWVVRLILIYVLVFGLLMILSVISSLTLTTVPIFEMAFQLMFPIFFIGSLAFMLSTFIRNGNGTAAVLIIIFLVIIITGDVLDKTKWFLFINPFQVYDDIDQLIMIENLFYNRIILSTGTVLAFLAGLLNLQKREKFI